MSIGLTLRQPLARFAAGVIAAHAISVLLIYDFARFRLGMMPVWCVFAAHAVVWLTQRLRSPNRRMPAVLGIVAVLLVTLVAFAPVANYRKHEAALTELFRGIQQHRQAAREASEALLNDAKDANAHQQLATALMAMGRVDEAVSHARTAADLRPDFAETRYEYARLLGQLGRTDEARQQLLEAVALQAGDEQTAMQMAERLQSMRSRPPVSSTN